MPGLCAKQDRRAQAPAGRQAPPTLPPPRCHAPFVAAPLHAHLRAPAPCSLPRTPLQHDQGCREGHRSRPGSSPPWRAQQACLRRRETTNRTRGFEVGASVATRLISHAVAAAAVPAEGLAQVLACAGSLWMAWGGNAWSTSELQPWPPARKIKLSISAVDQGLSCGECCPRRHRPHFSAHPAGVHAAQMYSAGLL